MRFLLPLRIFAAFAAVALAAPASAQCLLCGAAGNGPEQAEGGARGSVEERPLRVEIIADLDFARLVAGARGGTARIDPVRRGTIVSGDVRVAAGGAFSGRLMVVGIPGRMVRISMPDRATMSSAAGGRLEITGITTGQAPVQRIGPDGRLELPFGGDLQLNGVVDGDFRGRIAVTVSYE